MAIYYNSILKTKINPKQIQNKKLKQDDLNIIAYH